MNPPLMMDVPSHSNSDDKDIAERFLKAKACFDEGKRDEAIALLKENVDSGCTDSMVYLGIIYADGNEEERKDSIRLFEKAHSLGNDSGTRNLAYCNAIGLNVEKNKEKGAELYIIAAEAGNPRAMCNIGVMYDHGNGVDLDYEKAFGWYLKSAEGGYQRGMTNLGEHYLWGKGTDVNIDEAERWFKASGSPRALYRLCEIYLDIKKDEEKGMRYLKMSADAKYSRALYRYGRLIEDERRDDAIMMYNEAAAKGNKDSIERLKELDLVVPERRRKK